MLGVVVAVLAVGNNLDGGKYNTVLILSSRPQTWSSLRFLIACVVKHGGCGLRGP